MAIAILELLKLLKDVLRRQARDMAVLHLALTVRVMAEPAGTYTNWLGSVRDDVRHRRMIAGIPICRTPAIVRFSGRERIRRIRQHPLYPVIGIGRPSESAGKR